MKKFLYILLLERIFLDFFKICYNKQNHFFLFFFAKKLYLIVSFFFKKINL